MPNTEVKQSKASVFLPVNNGIMCSNPILGTGMCLRSSHLCFYMCAAALWQAGILLRSATRCLATRFWNLKKGETLCCFHLYQRRGEIWKALKRTLNQQHERSLVWILDGYGSLFFIILIKISIKIPHITKYKPFSFLLSLYHHFTSYDDVITCQAHTVLSQPKNQSNNCRDSNVYEQLAKNREEVMAQTGLQQ